MVPGDVSKGPWGIPAKKIFKLHGDLIIAHNNYHQDLEPTTQAAPTLALWDYFSFLLVVNIVTWADINPLLYAKDAQIKFFKSETFDSLV